MHVDFPTYEDLKAVVEKTFTASASFLPVRFEFWPTQGADAEKMIHRRSDFLAHSDVQLVRSLVKSLSFDELQLATGYTDGCKQAIIATDDKWTDLQFQIEWGKMTVGCTARGKFYAEGTSLRQQLFEDAATLFMDFLSIEFPIM
ncbi:hypothetical protein ABBQ38_002811 [Trebouxia sp. C0009 RCD-2024]